MKKIFNALLLMLFAYMSNAQIVPDSVCQILHPPTWVQRRVLFSNPPASDTTCFGVFIQTDYQMWKAFSGDTAAIATWVRAEFAENNFKIYQHDGALIYIDSIGFSKDSNLYNFTSSSYNLYAFASFCDSVKPTADLYQLYSFSLYNIGGVAFIDVLGATQQYYKTSYCNVYQSYGVYPIYSWTPEVTCHELGHNVGLPHTHSCYNTRLDGTTGPLDTCYNPEGGCYIGANIPRIGYIMSYCHLSAGISFVLGFGPEHKILLREKLYNAKLSGFLKDAYYYYTPTSIKKSNITSSSVTITWTSRKMNFKIAYRAKGATTWTYINVTNTHSFTLTMLASSTIFQVKVKAINTPTYGKIIQFKTL